jgi:hypothetical protein
MVERLNREIKRRTCVAFLPYRPWIKWSKILDKGPSTDAEISRFHSAVKILGTEQMTVHPLHQPINHVTRSMCARKIIGLGKLWKIPPELLDLG